MALATQCPHCQTTFRVAHDQLKLRAGLVRCGACKQIFNGIENLLRPEEMQPATPAAHVPVVDPPPPAVIETPVDPATKIPSANDLDFDLGVPEETEESPTLPAAVATPDDPLLRMTLMDFRAQREPDIATSRDSNNEAHADALDPLEQVIEDLQRRPLRGQGKQSSDDTDALDDIESPDEEEPSFVVKGRRRQRWRRASRVLMSAGSMLLLVSAFGQAAYVFRNEIAIRFPQTKPMLVNACKKLSCQIGLPAHIDSVSIESSELQALAPDSNAFALNVLLRNRGMMTQAWPNIELTLNDVADKPLVRRVFSPADYLSQQDAANGFTAGAEQPVRLQFELAKLKAAGYRVYLFYP